MKNCPICNEVEELNHSCLEEDVKRGNIDRESKGDFGAPFTYEISGDPEDNEYLLLDRFGFCVPMSGCTETFIQHIVNKLNSK